MQPVKGVACESRDVMQRPLLVKLKHSSHENSELTADGRRRVVRRSAPSSSQPRDSSARSWGWSCDLPKSKKEEQSPSESVGSGQRCWVDSRRWNTLVPTGSDWFGRLRTITSHHLVPAVQSLSAGGRISSLHKSTQCFVANFL